MSAYIVGTDLIDLIVTAAISGRGAFETYNNDEYETYTRENASDLGQLLIDANYQSFNYRYDEQHVPPVYKFREVRYFGGRLASYFDALNGIACLKYQSCEFPEWGESLALAILDRVRDCVIDRMMPDETPWEWSRTIQNERELDIRAALAAYSDGGQ